MRSVPLMMNVPRGHHREVAHEDRLLFDLTRLRVHEARGDEQRARVRHVALAALVLGMLRRVEDVVGQLELELAGEVLDRRNVAQDLGDTVLEEPSERVGLYFDEVRKFLDLAKLREGKALTGRETGQRHSNPERIKLRECGIASRAAGCATKGVDAGQPGDSGAVAEGQEDRRARAGRHGYGQHSELPCWLPVTANRAPVASATGPVCSVQDKPEPAGWQRLSRQIFAARPPHRGRADRTT